MPFPPVKQRSDHEGQATQGEQNGKQDPEQGQRPVYRDCLRRQRSQANQHGRNEHHAEGLDGAGGHGRVRLDGGG
jgi:hypothetical protein